MTFRDELKLKYPKMNARKETSRKAAMRLMCLECVGGVSAEVAACTDSGCPMHAFRPKTQTRPVQVPEIDTCEGSESESSNG